MLRVLRNHIFAARLKEVFESPLVLVYQTLGHVDHLGVKQQLQADLAKHHIPTSSAAGVEVDICHMKNTMAAATGNATLSRLFTNSNLLVGFKPQQQHQHQHQHQHLDSQPAAVVPEQQQQPDAQQLFQAATGRITRSMTPQQIVGGLLQQPLPGPHIPQPQLKACVESGASLTSCHPVVLIGAFYKRSATPLGYLKQWIKLDPAQVYGELLGSLEAPITELFVFEGSTKELLACFDDAAGPAIVNLVEYKAAAGDAAGAADAAGQQS